MILPADDSKSRNMSESFPAVSRQVVVGLAILTSLGLGGCRGSSESGNSKADVETPVRSTEKSMVVELNPKPVDPAPLERTPAESSQGQDSVAESRRIPEQIFRPDDVRPVHDDKKLAELGINVFESQRLKLYTDIEPKFARSLPGLIDQAYQALVDYFGPLPPSRSGAEFQMTGYLIGDEALFREAGLIPLDLPPFEHGRHRRNEFWMREQRFEYYRRHLLIHEATHCFMTVLPDVDAPVWYMEGMAECFGTHRIDADGTARFRVMPTSPEDFAGSGRITAIRNDLAAGHGKAIGEILDFKAVEFLKTEQYAWSWGLSMFLNSHPRYRDRFRELGGYLQRNAFPTHFHKVFSPVAGELNTEWMLFSRNLQYGFDIERAAIEFLPGLPLDLAHPRHEVRIQSDRGWQSSGIHLEKDQICQLQAQGRFVLAQRPKDWVADAGGVSFRYFEGIPLGMLLGALHGDSVSADQPTDSMLRISPIGRSGVFKAREAGTLYLRLNDEWNSLHDNHGEVVVEIGLGQE